MIIQVESKRQNIERSSVFEMHSETVSDHLGWEVDQTCMTKSATSVCVCVGEERDGTGHDSKTDGVGSTIKMHSNTMWE